MTELRIVFMGTPEFAVPTLRGLAQHYQVVGVVTQPDQPAGRGRQVQFSPVKQLALALDLPLIQPQKLRAPEAQAQLAAWAPDLIVVAAFGQILKPAVLDLPPHGCLNVHASLLPRHRGAAPIMAAVAAGDAETGVTIMRMDPGLDTGPMLKMQRESIRPDDTAGTLSARLAEIGAALLLEVLPEYVAGRLTPQTQPEIGVTYAPQIKKEEGHLDFTRPAVELERRVRAYIPWPGAFALWQGQPFKILRAAAVGFDTLCLRDFEMGTDALQPPGTILSHEQGPVVVCGAGGLLLQEVQAAGKKPMAADAFARGARNFIGTQLT